MRLLPRSFIFLFLALCWGCGSSTGDVSSATTTQTAPTIPQQVTVNISGTSLARTESRFAGSVVAFRASLLSAQGTQLATVTVPRDSSKDPQTVALAVTAILNLTLTVEALDNSGSTLFSLTRQISSSGTVSVSDADFSSGPLPTTSSASNLPTITGLSPHMGPAGTWVNVTGTNLTGATSVTFGALPGSIYPNGKTDTSIWVSAPFLGVGTVPVRVTTPAGTSAISDADFFTFTPQLYPEPPAQGPGTAPPVQVQ